MIIFGEEQKMLLEKSQAFFWETFHYYPLETISSKHQIKMIRYDMMWNYSGNLKWAKNLCYFRN